MCVSAAAFAQRSSELSADIPEIRVMAVQQKVERLFEADEFERAFFIYRNELAPLGDKYAQYMVGYMYQTGMGVEQDSILAAAWYQLAAERDTPEFVVVRDRFLQTMDQGDADRSKVLYRELRFRYCDIAVLFASIKRNFKELQVRTGSRLGGKTSPITIIESRPSRSDGVTDYYERVRRELAARVLLLKEIGEFEDLDGSPDHINIHELEQRVRHYIEADAG